jgi:pimeloyl-ACP methyl ester carboxylesterase
VLVDTLHDVSQRRAVSGARADAERLRADFKGYFADLSALFARGADPAVRHWVEAQAQAADPAAMIALKLDTPNLDPIALFQHAGVPIRAINARPPLSDPTNLDENQRHADYDVTLLDDAGHFLPLECPRRFNAALEHWISALAKPAR